MMEPPPAATVVATAHELEKTVMKKIMMLVGLAAAAYGAMRLFRNKEEEQYNFDDFTTAQPQV